MIKQYTGAKAEKTQSGERIPAGGYVAQVKSAEVAEYSWGDVLILHFDIAEGDYKDFYAKEYRANQNEDKKWKGNVRINIPSEGNQYFESQQRTFNNLIYAFEDSNSGYHFNWDEATLKGKKIGVLIRNKEFEKEDGSTGWWSEPFAVTDVDTIKNGKFKMPKDKELANKKSTPAPTMSSKIDFEEITDNDLPF